MALHDASPHVHSDCTDVIAFGLLHQENARSVAARGGRARNLGQGQAATLPQMYASTVKPRARRSQCLPVERHSARAALADSDANIRQTSDAQVWQPSSIEVL